MPHNDPCQRAYIAISHLCEQGPTGHDDNTIWMELVISQGRQVQPDDFLEVEQFIEDTILDEIAGGVQRPDTDQTGIFSVPGEDRPGDKERPSTGGSRNTIHTFIRFGNDTLPVGQLGTIKFTLERRFNESGLAVGRGLDRVNIVDEKVVARTAPERAGVPREDATYL